MDQGLETGGWGGCGGTPHLPLIVNLEGEHELRGLEVVLIVVGDAEVVGQRRRLLVPDIFAQLVVCGLPLVIISIRNYMVASRQLTGA